jgi:hypothetical protein
MKNLKLISLTILMAGLFITSCSKKDALTSDFDKSYKAWLSFKESSNNSYKYKAIHGSLMGSYSETVITITNGAVTGRDYVFYEYQYHTDNTPPTKVLKKEWQETTSDLGTHGAEGAGLNTLDDIYNTAKNSWITADPSKNTIIFETNNNGMISVAGYIPKKCQDDCLIGITIQSITKL